MSRVYGWMTFGILLTGVIAYQIGQRPEIAQEILTNRPLFWALVIAQLGAVMGMSLLIRKISSTVAAGLFLLYAALTGVTFSTLFLLYTGESIYQVFGITAFAFGGLSAFGLVTKRDLGPIGSFCTMGLFGLVGFSLLSIFFPSMQAGVSGQVYSLVGIIVFSGLTAYDTQKIKAMNQSVDYLSEDGKKGAIFGALTLYLDFINLFLSILRMTGRRQ